MSLQEYQTARGIIYTTVFLYVLIGTIVHKAAIRWLGDSFITTYQACFIILSIYLLVLIIGMNVRRLHDIGHSALWVLSPIFFIRKFYMGIDEDEGEPGQNSWGANPTETRYEPTENIPPCPPDIHDLYKRAVRNNDSSACYELGKRYFFGDGIQRNAILAMHWLQKGAHSGSTDALLFLNSLSAPNSTKP